jgi:OmpA family
VSGGGSVLHSEHEWIEWVEAHRTRHVIDRELGLSEIDIHPTAEVPRCELVKLYDDRKALIVGHTDAMGDAAYNQYLATRRAEMVKEFFVENSKIEQTRLSIEGKGEEQPIASNATQDGRTANRRVEVLLLN